MRRRMDCRGLLAACVTGAAVTLLFARGAALAQGESRPLPEGPGLAARYAGDEGLEQDARVLFVEDFETGTIRELSDRWGNALFSSGIEPWHDWNKYPPPGVWHFYSYWHEMKPDGVGHYWGNFFNAPQEPIEAGR